MVVALSIGAGLLFHLINPDVLDVGLVYQEF